MSNAQTATKSRQNPTPAPADPKVAGAAAGLMSELRVSAHLMNLEAGLFCVVQTPSPAADPRTGLPGVRLSLPPGSASRPEAVTISGFHEGWLSGAGDAALVRVAQGPAQLLVTIYQAPNAPDGSAPNLQVMRLLEPAGRPPAAGLPAAVPVEAARAAPARSSSVMEMVAHIQERGDIGAMFGEWLGEAGSRRWIEGFGLSPLKGIAAKDIEYQAVLGRGWLSPWVEGGQFCGSRAMALPVLGFRVRLRGDAAATHSVSYSATFIDGTRMGPVSDGEPCESEALVGMESFTVAVQPHAVAAPAPTQSAKAVEKPKKEKAVQIPPAKSKPAPTRKR
jgi:hypothetical protein